jgi:hypothetical protein
VAGREADYKPIAVFQLGVYGVACLLSFIGYVFHLTYPISLELSLSKFKATEEVVTDKS